MDDKFKAQMERTAAMLEKAHYDPELKDAASEALQEVYEDHRDVSTQEGREDAMLRYLQREAERFKADAETLATLDADEPRTRALCTCSDSGCALKDGRLPVLVETAETLQKGIREFRRQHRGNPVVLDDADKKLTEKEARIQRVYDTIIISLSNEVPIDELRERREGDGEPTEDDAAGAEADAATDEPAE